jgi:triacylglycerol lipase
MSHRPVVLVHGWNSHPGVWNRLVPRLEELGFPIWNFAHDKCVNLAPDEIAYLLQDYIGDRRAATGYEGEIDLVCHSMGGCIARYLIEVIDGQERSERVRQLVGLGPPNNGSALAEIFFDPDMGPGVIEQLTGSFVPPGFKPDEDRIVREFRFGSRTISHLQQAGTRDDIAYRMILSGNRQLRPEFFPPFEGRTWEYDPEEGWRKTCDGDGIVPHRDSWLPGAEHVILPAGAMPSQSPPDHYCHIYLPRNAEVIALVVKFLSLADGHSTEV